MQPPLAEAALAADLITAFFSHFLAALAAKKNQKIVEISVKISKNSQLCSSVSPVCLYSKSPHLQQSVLNELAQELYISQLSALGLAEASLARGIAEVTAHRDRAAVRSPFNREEALAALRREAASPASPA